MVVCAIANVHRGKDDAALKPADLMPWLADKEREREDGKQTPEQMRKIMEEVTLAMGGIIHRRNVPLG